MRKKRRRLNYYIYDILSILSHGFLGYTQSCLILVNATRRCDLWVEPFICEDIISDVNQAQNTPMMS